MCRLSLLERPAQNECVSNGIHESLDVFPKAFLRIQSICSDAGIVDDS